MATFQDRTAALRVEAVDLERFVERLETGAPGVAEAQRRLTALREESDALERDLLDRKAVLSEHVDDDLDVERDRQNIGEMDDVTLVFVTLGLNGEMEGAAEWTPRARTFRRLAFTEIATRWIPPDVFGDAFRRLTEDDEGGGDDA
jgi:hypothetical protein